MQRVLAYIALIAVLAIAVVGTVSTDSADAGSEEGMTQELLKLESVHGAYEGASGQVQLLQHPKWGQEYQLWFSFSDFPCTNRRWSPVGEFMYTAWIEIGENDAQRLFNFHTNCSTGLAKQDYFDIHENVLTEMFDEDVTVFITAEQDDGVSYRGPELLRGEIDRP